MSVNDIKIADKSWGKYEFIIPKEVWKKDGNRLKIEVTPSIANKYYNNTKFKPEKLLKMGKFGPNQLENAFSMILRLSSGVSGLYIS